MKFLGGLANVILLFSIISCVLGATLPPHTEVNTDTDALEYLNKYGYTPGGEGVASQVDRSKFRDYVRRFQYMAGLNQTGELDADTKKMMNTPRCSVSDNVGYDAAKRRRRYVVQGSLWPTTSLTYSFSRYSAKLGTDQVRRIMETSLKDWSDASAMTFRETTSAQSRNHIEILFAPGSHGDRSPFDGVGGVLAHAYFPDSGGDAHFDDDERWSDGSVSGTNLRQVATHEIGHSLGLGHSNDRSAVMYAFYNGYQPNFKLQDDDIRGIQYLYGAPRNSATQPQQTNPPTTTTRAVNNPATTRAVNNPTTTRFVNNPTTTRQPAVVTTRSVPDYCRSPKIDAMVVVVEGVTYAFSGDNYFVLNEYGVVPGYPRKIYTNWFGPSSIDAALYFEGRIAGEVPHLFLFKGSQYWRYTNVNSLDAGYPRNIADGFPGIPDNLDSALIWSGNGQTYFFKGSNYYRYTRGVGTDYGYPRSISVWRGLPVDGIDAAAQWINFRTYFFKGDQYWRFNDRDVAVDQGGYPRPIGQWWFGCSSALTSNELQDAGQSGDQYRVNKAMSFATHHPICYFFYSALILLLLTFSK